MDYEKAYKAVLKTATQWIEDGCTDKEKICLESVFPELRESEDEKIRKALINYFKAHSALVGENWNGIECDDVIAYLEKQKEQSITANDLDEEIHRFFDDCIDVHEAKLYGSVSERVIPVDCYEITARHFAKWGEKQKEQKHPNGCFTCDEYKKGYEAGRSNGFTAGYNKAMKEQKPVEYLPTEKVYAIMTKLTELSASNLIPINSPEYLKIHQITKDVRSLLDYPIEQKPAEWSEEDESKLNHILGIVHIASGREVSVDEKEELESFIKSLHPQPKQGWSEEDEKMLVGIIERGSSQIPPYEPALREEQMEWLMNRLKSLRPQKLDASKLENFDPVDVLNRIKAEWPMAWEKVVGEQEWSEEDEDMLNSCISSIEEAKENRYAYKETDGDTSYDHEIAWLKSLRNRPKSSDNWKPSEEQMEAFKGYIEDFKARAEAAVGGWNNFDVMIQLYEQIKNL